MRNAFWRPVARIVPGLLLVAVSIYAQVTTATIYGLIVDSSGAAISGAKTTVSNELTALATAVTTNERGEFSVTFLPVGRYTISVEATGFKLYKQTGVELTAGQKANLTFTLEVGPVNESITVVGETPLLNLTNAQQNVS